MAPAHSPEEADADRFADAFMSGTRAVAATAGGGDVYRKCSCQGEGCESCGESVHLARDGSGASPGRGAATEMSQLSGGEPIPPSLRQDLEATAGHGLGEVRLHRNPRGASLAEDLGADAATYGQHIVFRDGSAQDIDSTEGRRLLAHEVAHTRQRGNQIRLNGGGDDEPIDYGALLESSPELAQDIAALDSAVEELVERAGALPWHRVGSAAESRFRRAVRAVNAARSRLLESFTSDRIRRFLTTVGGVLDRVHAALRVLESSPGASPTLLVRSSRDRARDLRNSALDRLSAEQSGPAAPAPVEVELPEPEPTPAPEMTAEQARERCADVLRERGRTDVERVVDPSASGFSALPEGGWDAAADDPVYLSNLLGAVSSDLDEQRRGLEACAQASDVEVSDSEWEAWARDLVRLEAIRLLSEQRDRLRTRGRELTSGGTGSAEARENERAIREAALEAMRLEALEEHFSGWAGALSRVGISHGDPADHWEIISDATRSYRTSRMSEVIAERRRHMRSMPHRGPGDYRRELTLLARDLRREREQQAQAARMGRQVIYMAFPFFNQTEPEEYVDMSGDRERQLAVMRGFGSVRTATDEAITAIGSGRINVFALPEAVQRVERSLSGDVATRFREVVDRAHAELQLAQTGLMVAEAIVAFIPVIGPTLALSLAAAQIGMDLDELLDRQTLQAAAITPDRSTLGASAVEWWEWALFSVDAILTVAEVPALRSLGRSGGGRVPAALADELSEAGADLTDVERRMLRQSSGEGPIDGPLLRNEVDIVARRQAQEVRYLDADGRLYDREIDLGNGHHWRRDAEHGTWCRFSPPRPSICINLIGDTRLLDVPPIEGEQFQRWFDSLTPDEFQQVWESPLRASVERRLRHPGGYHEWFMVSRADKLRALGVTARDIWAFRTRTRALRWRNPHTGLPGRHGGHGSGAFHNELGRIIDESESLEDIRAGLDDLASRWQITNLPAWIR